MKKVRLLLSLKVRREAFKQQTKLKRANAGPLSNFIQYLLMLLVYYYWGTNNVNALYIS